MIRLRPYNSNDAEKILTWANNADIFYKWTAGILGDYPLTVEQFSGVSNLMAFTAIDDDEIIGFFTMRRPSESFDELRFGFVIVDPEKRGKSYGRKMLQLGLKYAKEIYGAKKVTLGVFANNDPAHYCYQAAGFKDIVLEEIEKYEVLGEIWDCLEMECVF